MKRDTKIVLAVTALVPAWMLAAAVFCTWAIAEGASPRWRLPFRLTCHGMAERCLVLWGTPMPVCARCTGIYAGLLAGLAAFLLFRVRERVMRVAVLAAAFPMGIDGLTQLAGLRESTNPLRIATGILAGAAFGMWVLSAVERPGDEVFTAS